MSDIDWSKAPEWATKYGLVGGEDRSIFYNGTQYQYLNGGQCNQAFKFEVGFKLKEIVFIEIRPSKPVYTQAMADNGELPLVGMECMGFIVLRGSVKYEWHRVDVLFAFDEECAIKSIKHTTLHYCDEFKPLTPPIELIDGKAYQFDYCNSSRVGLYNKDDDRIMWLSTYAKTEDCTNIQELGVLK